MLRPSACWRTMPKPRPGGRAIDEDAHGDALDAPGGVETLGRAQCVGKAMRLPPRFHHHTGRVRQVTPGRGGHAAEAHLLAHDLRLLLQRA